MNENTIPSSQNQMPSGSLPSDAPHGGAVKNEFFHTLFHSKVGKITTIALATLGCTSSLLIALTSLGLPAIPVIWFLAESGLCIISSAALVVLTINIITIIFLIKGKDIYDFSDQNIELQRKAFRAYMLATTLLPIEWKQLEIDKLGSEIGKDIDAFRNACAEHEADENSFSSIVLRIVQDVFHLGTQKIENIVGQASRIFSLLNEFHPKDGSRDLHDLLVAVCILEDYFDGKYENEIPSYAISGVGNFILKLNNHEHMVFQYADHMLPKLKKIICDEIVRKRLHSKIIPFDWDGNAEIEEEIGEIALKMTAFTKNDEGCIIVCDADQHNQLIKLYNNEEKKIHCYTENSVESLRIALNPGLKRTCGNAMEKYKIDKNSSLIRSLASNGSWAIRTLGPMGAAIILPVAGIFNKTLGKAGEALAKCPDQFVEDHLLAHLNCTDITPCKGEEVDNAPKQITLTGILQGNEQTTIFDSKDDFQNFKSLRKSISLPCHTMEIRCAQLDLEKESHWLKVNITGAKDREGKWWFALVKRKSTFQSADQLTWVRYDPDGADERDFLERLLSTAK
ncbi:MAG: hypothetical protein LBI69_03310 [Puniceicoccales bacterium]|jgi:hypothetical protein|nr:hypothetical protein [Puniceicoccales bacterium]